MARGAGRWRSLCALSSAIARRPFGEWSPWFAHATITRVVRRIQHVAQRGQPHPGLVFEEVAKLRHGVHVTPARSLPQLPNQLFVDTPVLQSQRFTATTRPATELVPASGRRVVEGVVPGRASSPGEGNSGGAQPSRARTTVRPETELTAQRAERQCGRSGAPVQPTNCGGFASRAG
jgi:hypothetical protein